MYPHRIRLRGPWDCEPLARTGAGNLPPARRLTLPCRWSEGGLVGFAGRVRFLRRFGYPGRIDAHERVWLTAAGVDASAELNLNGTAIGSFSAAGGPFEAEVTALLRPRNELAVEVEGGVNGGLWGEVALEVRCTAFLRAVRVEFASGSLQISGTVAGQAERPLELYAVLDRRTAAYAVVTPTPEGTPFCLTAEVATPAAAGEPAALRLDLVNGASVWYTVEQVLAAPPAGRPQS
jgi:hypothetical protein